MITLVKPSIRGYGILFFGGLLEGRGAYEILVSEEIRGNPESIPLRFDVVDDESIAICRDLT